MTIHAGTARQINSYHHSATLLFQFILSEFIDAYAEIKHLDALCHAHETTDWRIIQASMKKLIGSPRDYMRLFTWGIDEGYLSKLKAYCALHVQKTDSEGKELIALQHYAEKVWQACIQSYDLLTGAPQDRPAFLAAIEKTVASMQRLAKHLTRIIHQFREDENIIYFVIKNHKAFDKLYGSRFVFKLLGRLYPKGIRETQQFLAKKYAARGFDNIVSAIQSHITDIEVAAL